ncbi:MAG: DUF11 domain-containing protein, partial [Anaerolineae bacterium]|nr:DUF11 domain-containing protein [Anaerolineae bacterium]
SDTDDATVTIRDVPSAIEVLKTADPTVVDEPGGNVMFTVVVNNLSVADTVTITSLIDTVYGDLNGQGDCSVPQVLPVGGSYTCSFVGLVSGNAGEVHTNVVTASGVDDDGDPVSDDDEATVTIRDVPSLIEVIKSANPTVVAEPGGNVTFTVVVNNLSVVDTVTITSLIDTMYGDLNGEGDCSVPQVLPVGGSYTCSFVGPVTGNAGEVHTNVVTASGVDDDGYPVSDSDDATVVIVSSAIDVTKTLVSVPPVYVGDDVQFQIVVENTGDRLMETVSLTDTYDPTKLSFVSATPPDDDAGAVDDGTLTWSDLGALEPGGKITVTVSFVAVAPTVPGDTENVATATAIDDLGNEREDTDSDVVEILSNPLVQVTKTASPPEAVQGVVTFTIEIENIGNTLLVQVPLRDEYFGPVDFKLSLPYMPDDVDEPNQVLEWYDLTGPAFFNRDLDVGETFVLTVVFDIDPSLTTFTMQNVAIVDGAEDVYGRFAPRDEDDAVVSGDTGAPYVTFDAWPVREGVLVTADVIREREVTIWRSTTSDPLDAVLIATELAVDGKLNYLDTSVVHSATYWYWLEEDGAAQASGLGLSVTTLPRSNER